MKNTNTFLSYHQLLFPIILTEFLRRASLLPLEHTIEIGQIVEAAVIAHLCNGTRESTNIRVAKPRRISIM
mgnify:CR=1 FL=1